MKPIHKFNNGSGATLCHRCRTIITTGFSGDLYCKRCLKLDELGIEDDYEENEDN